MIPASGPTYLSSEFDKTISTLHVLLMRATIETLINAHFLTTLDEMT